MSPYKSPINRTIVIGCALFIVLLCALEAVQTYLSSSDALYEQYDARLRDAVTFVERRADADDLAECIRTGIPSIKSVELQELLNDVIDPFELSYLYIVVPKDSEDGTLYTVLAATSDAERAAGDEDWPLMYDVSDSYTREEVLPLLRAWDAEDIFYYEGTSDWGLCYTACKPLRASSGETVALICADLLVNELHDSVKTYVMRNTALTAIIGVIFGLLLIVWLQRNITGPILALEKRARQFTEQSRDGKGADALLFDASDIHADNELQLLVNVFSSMTLEMKSKAETSASAEARAMSAEHEIEGMFRIAYQDALTHVKNKSAYDAKCAELSVDIAAQKAEFAIVMVDLNNLKQVNDTYGHKNGDKYIVGACEIVCTVYDHSPVFRIGGDEFVAVLQGRDYASREELFITLTQRIADAQDDMSREPWDRYSAAAGMAVYKSGVDRSVEDVFRRADNMMYESKKRTKKEHSFAASNRKMTDFE